jgi:multicomponent Na+:H+ antiporter subunit D
VPDRRHGRGVERAEQPGAAPGDAVERHARPGRGAREAVAGQIGRDHGEALGKPGQQRFFGFFSLCVSTTVGIAFAENLLTLFVFYELLTVCTYPLIMHNENLEARRAGRKYLVYTLSGGGLILAGMLAVYSMTGTLSLAEAGILEGSIPHAWLLAIFVLLIAGFGVKAALMPLHAWLPAAMVAPTPVSALLHAVAVVKAGVFGILRTIYNVFGVDLLRDLGYAHWLAMLAGTVILIASVKALRQTNFKARLAWSTISQLSYIVLAAALLAPLAALAAIMHIANQAFAKITMFFVAGAIERATGKTRVDQLAGIGRQMPWTMASFTLASLSFMGVPLMAGFVTKWYLSLGALQAGSGIFVGVMVLSGLLNASYWLPMVYQAWFRPPADTGVNLVPISPMMVVPILVCAGYVILLGIGANAPAMPFSVAEAAARFAFELKVPLE